MMQTSKLLPAKWETQCLNTKSQTWQISLFKTNKCLLWTDVSPNGDLTCKVAVHGATQLPVHVQTTIPSNVFQQSNVLTGTDFHLHIPLTFPLIFPCYAPIWTFFRTGPVIRVALNLTWALTDSSDIRRLSALSLSWCRLQHVCP